LNSASTENVKRHWVRERYEQVAFHPLDITIIAYLLILGFLIILFHNNVSRWGWYPIGHVLIVFLLLEFLRMATIHPSKILHFLRTFYPALGLALLWIELNSLVTMILPYWANDFLVGLDKAIFGVHPTVWVETIFTPWLTELMNFFYAFYYLYIPILTFPLYFQGRREETLDILYLIMFTYCTVFLIFLLFPAEGPWVILKELHTAKPTGGFFLRLNQFIQGGGSIKGGCFPSSHVAAAYTMLWASFRYHKRLGFFLLPCVFGMASATVYCQYHHAVDALSGMILGTILYFVGIVVLKHWHRKHRIQKA
jgi:membrane-associated phospholipid phosphatase